MKYKVLPFIMVVLLANLPTKGFVSDQTQGRLLIILNVSSSQDHHPVPDAYFLTDIPMAPLERMLAAFDAIQIESELKDDGVFSCYYLSSDTVIHSNEQKRFLCISPSLQLDNQHRVVAVSPEGTDEEREWHSVFLCNKERNFIELFSQQLNYALTYLWRSLFALNTNSEEKETNNTEFLLPEISSHSPNPMQLSEGDFPFDPPPPPFMPGTPVKGVFNMPDVQFDYFLSLFWIKDQLWQWLHRYFKKPQESQNTFYVYVPLAQKCNEQISRKSFEEAITDALELLTKLTGKILSNDHLQPPIETVRLYPLFVQSQTAPHSLEERSDVEFVKGNCNICLGDFEDSEDVVRTVCSHTFHVGCLAIWLNEPEPEQEDNKKTSCPSCRYKIGGLRDVLIRQSSSNVNIRIITELQEIDEFIQHVMAGRVNWPDNDTDIYSLLERAKKSGNSDAINKAKELTVFADFYSVHHLVSKMNSRTGAWPAQDDYIFDRLKSAEISGNRDIFSHVQALRPFVNFYSVQHLVSQMQAGTGVWPDNDDDIYSMLLNVQMSGYRQLSKRAIALRRFVYLYSLRRLLLQIRSGARAWPDNDRYIYSRLNSVLRSGDPELVPQARKLRQLINFHYVKNFVMQMQPSAMLWPVDNRVIYTRLLSAQRGPDRSIAQQAKQLKALVDFYSVQRLVSQMQSGARAWPDKDKSVYTKLRNAQNRHNQYIALHIQELKQYVNYYSVRHLVLQIGRGQKVWPINNDHYIFTKLRSAKTSSNRNLSEQAKKLELFIYQNHLNKR